LKLRIIVLVALLQILGFAPLHAQVPPEYTTLIEVIANQSAYNGKRIRVIGYLNLEFEGDGLYLDKASFDAAIHNAVWVERPNWLGETDARALSKGYALVEGTFTTRHDGHMGMFAGAISEVTRIERWPSHDEFDDMAARRASGWPTYLFILFVTSVVGLATYRVAYRIFR
jgi:hypothetical protein